MYTTLYARALNGKIKVWTIMSYHNSIATTNGYFFNEKATHIAKVSMSSIEVEIISKIKKKKQEGYKDINDIFLLTNNFPTEAITESWLQANLPITNVDANYNLKPMKCQPFKKGKMKYPAIAQPKLNGVRATLRWEKNIIQDGLFSKLVERAVIRSKSGLEYYFPHITNNIDYEFFLDKDTELEVAYDGELYLHDTPLNIINSACPLINANGTIAQTSNPHIYSEIQFIVFDIAIEDLVQSNRITIVESLAGNERWIKPLLHSIVHDDNEVAEYTMKCIANGYEGAVIRNMDAEYAFGSRPVTIMKSKHFMDAEFEIIDVRSFKKEPDTGMFVLKNNINDEIFECVSMASYEQRKNYLANKEIYIGKMATVKFYERSGVKQVPFHANVVTIRDYE
jgi:ATP-dependent DNA ligase